MAVLTFDDLVSKQYLTRQKVDLPGVGTVEMMQLSALEASEIAKAMEPLEDLELELFMSRHALAFVKGSEPTDMELEGFRKNNSAKTIASIFTAGIRGATPIVDDMEQAEKN